MFAWHIDIPGTEPEPEFADICKNDAAGYGGAIFAGGNVSGFCPPANFQPSPSAYREPSFGHGTLDILNATHAYWQWHRNQV